MWINPLSYYGVPIWYKTCGIRKIILCLVGSKRSLYILFRVMLMYQTLSTEAVQVIAGILLIDLLMEEQRCLYKYIDFGLQTTKLVARSN